MWYLLRRRRQFRSSHLSGSQLSVSHFPGSDEGRLHGGDTPAPMYVARTSKIKLSGEGKPMHELQSLSPSPEYQHSHYPGKRSPDPQSPSHTSYELP